jgi:Asp-tRNA(Asn)/Glu-tRNA(Gln) amidotransferase A subunit family amidase
MNRLYALLLAAALCPLQSFAQEPAYSTQTIERLYGLSFTKAERDSMATNLANLQKSLEAIHQYKLNNDVPMSLIFDPLPIGFTPDQIQKPVEWGLPKDVKLPANKEEIAFLPVHKLAVLIRDKKITSLELTRLYIERIKRYSDTLQCVISVMEATALQRAAQADAEIAAGKYKGPLHGIPYGIKDLFSVDGTKTTWGAAPYKDQVIDGTATVVKKLNDAGGVLICKFTMGALAMGDIWYGGMTRNPWNLAQGSSGSSAGSASGTAAGLVAYAIGTETWGSIVSPATRCGVTGLRPTYGRVSRTGAMALSWSMDKVGPICRSALDCALVLNVIRGTDGKDKHVRDAAFNYSSKSDIKKLKVGYLAKAFEADYPTKKNDLAALEVIRSLGVDLTIVDLPDDKVPVAALRIMLSAEAAAAFDNLTRSNLDDELTDQRRGAWPNSFRSSHFIPAVDYINASRIRTELIAAYHERTKGFDVIISPTFGGNQSLMTNLTGHPCISIPNGFDAESSPNSITFLGKLFGEAAVVALARAYQEATGWDEKAPPLFFVKD